MKLSAMLAAAKNPSRPARANLPEIDPNDHVPGLDPIPDLPPKRADGWPADATNQLTHPPKHLPPSDLGVFIDDEGQAWLAARTAGSPTLTLFLGPLPRFHQHTPF
jgi:hypothetical protein